MASSEPVNHVCIRPSVASVVLSGLMAMHDLAFEPGSLLVLVCAPPLVRRAVPGQNRKENYGFYILDSCTNSGACSILIHGAMGVKWTTLTFKELAAQRTLRMDARYWIKKKASSRKPQASGYKQKKT